MVARRRPVAALLLAAQQSERVLVDKCMSRRSFVKLPSAWEAMRTLGCVGTAGLGHLRILGIAGLRRKALGVCSSVEYRMQLETLLFWKFVVYCRTTYLDRPE